MPSRLTIRVKGLEDLEAKMLQMQNSLGYQRLQDVCFDAVRQIRDLALVNVRRNRRTPRESWSGELERSLIAQPSKSTVRPGAWAKASQKVAPHAHLVEFGHRIVTHSGRDTGKTVQGYPFFRPAVDSLRAKIRMEITETIKRLVSGGAA